MTSALGSCEPACPAFATALASTLRTGALAAWGANDSTACASSAGMPRIMSTTRRALRGVTRTYRAIALASIVSSPVSARAGALAPTPAVILDVAAECAGGGELPELVADHRLGDEHRDVLTAVMHRDRVAQHRRDDHGTARPRLDDVPRPLVVLAVHLLDQVVVHKGALLKATRHYGVLLPLLLAASADDQAVAGLVFGAGTAFGLAPRADRVAPAGALALAAA